MKIIGKFQGGSFAYGLSTPESDLDYRWVFLHTDFSKIIGLNKQDHDAAANEESNDNFGYELRFFLKLLQKGNSQATELLWNTNWIQKTPEFDLIQSHKFKLMDSEKLFRMLLGYINGEKRIITGQNTGKLGEKRKVQLEKFGYSFRNVVHALRLLRTGILFFKYNIYPVNIVEQDKDYGKFILDVKTNPQNHKVDNLIRLIENQEQELKETFDTRYLNHKFDIDVANEICYSLYIPILNKQNI